jgi:hypothetical protein
VDIESLEAVSRDPASRAVCLRLARISRRGRLHPFLTEIERNEELGEETKARIAELAADDSFLRSVETYILATRALH